MLDLGGVGWRRGSVGVLKLRLVLGVELVLEVGLVLELGDNLKLRGGVEVGELFGCCWSILPDVTEKTFSRWYLVAILSKTKDIGT